MDTAAETFRSWLDWLCQIIGYGGGQARIYDLDVALKENWVSVTH